MSWRVVLEAAALLVQVAAATLAIAHGRRGARRVAWGFLAGGMLAVAAWQLTVWLLLPDTPPPSPAWGIAGLSFALLALAGLALALAREEETSRTNLALAGSEKRMRFLLDRVAEAYLIMDNGRIAFASRPFRHLFGVAAEAAIGMRFEDLVAPSSLETYRGRYEGTPQSVGGHRVELAIRHVDGEHRWVEATFQLMTWEGKPAELACLADITERWVAQQALRESEERFRGLVEHAVIGIYRTTRAGVILMANPALAAMLGYESGEDLIRQRPEEWTGAERDGRASFMATLEQDGVVNGVESFWTRRDGTRILVRENARLIRGEGDEAACYEGTVEDLTAQHELTQQLQHAQKMEAVGRLAGGVAHDFNNILQALSNTAFLIRQGAGNAELCREKVAELEEHVARGAQFTRQLLLFSRRTPGQARRLDLNEVVGASARLLQRLLREDIALRLELTGPGMAVSADSGQLEQVIMNLALNAADAMPEGGKLTIRTARAEDGSAVLAVEDTGQGIPEEIRGKVFEPFFTTKPAGKGTGLGLSVVHGIVTQHGGRIEVDSEVGKRTVVRIVLPGLAGEDQAAGSRPELALLPTPAGQGERVLVVEDQGAVRDSLAGVLTSAGYRVRTAASAEEAMRDAEREGFDLLLTDLVLPGISGATLIAALRNRWPDMRSVLISGYAEAGALPEGTLGRRCRFLQKPFPAEALTAAVRAALDEA